MRIKTFLLAIMTTAFVPVGPSYSMDESMPDEGMAQARDQFASELTEAFSDLSVYELQNMILRGFRLIAPGVYTVQYHNHLIQMKTDDFRALSKAFYDPFNQANNGLITHMTNPDFKSLKFISVEKKEGDPTRYWVNFSLVTNENGKETTYPFHFTVKP